MIARLLFQLLKEDIGVKLKVDKEKLKCVLLQKLMTLPAGKPYFSCSDNLKTICILLNLRGDVY